MITLPARYILKNKYKPSIHNSIIECAKHFNIYRQENYIYFRFNNVINHYRNIGDIGVRLIYEYNDGNGQPHHDHSNYDFDSLNYIRIFRPKSAIKSGQNENVIHVNARTSNDWYKGKVCFGNQKMPIIRLFRNNEMIEAIRSIKEFLEESYQFGYFNAQYLMCYTCKNLWKQCTCIKPEINNVENECAS